MPSPELQVAAATIKDMAELFLVRHAQAAFGTDDYDRLTDLGHQQAQWLGDYFRERGLRFDRAVTGTLRRHRETLQGIVSDGDASVTVSTDGRLNEYDPERLVAAHLAAVKGERGSVSTPQTDSTAAEFTQERKQHFRLLRAALTSWTEGRLDPGAHSTFKDFQKAAYQAFEQACSAQSERERVLIVSSGGPIASILAHQLEMPPSSFVALNLQIRNSGFSELRLNVNGAQLISFNNVPHLDTLQRRRNITFS